jgi:hypothetical protein
VFLNGVLAARLRGRGSSYDEYDINAEAAKMLKPGVNHIALHCIEGKGEQFIDVGLVQEQQR